MSAGRRLEVLGGAGTVCREGAIVAWFGPGFPPKLASAVLDRVRAAPARAAALAAAVEGVVSADAGALAIVAEAEAGLAVVVQGHVVVSEQGLERLRGSAGGGLVSGDLAASSGLTVRGDADPELLDRPGSLPFDLRAGVVPGGGMTFWAAELTRPSGPPELDRRVVIFDLSTPEIPLEPLPMAWARSVSVPAVSASPVSSPPTSPLPPAPPPAPASETEVPQALEAQSGREEVGTAQAADADPDVPVTAVPLTEPPAATAALAAVDAPAAPPAGEPHASPSPDQHVVRGVNCARSHFNNPHALYCGICGLAMVQNSVIVVDGPRPPLGVLLLDDGTAYSLDGDYVLGREPDHAPDVVEGRARSLKVDDGTGKISRVHARVALRDWDVVVTDLGSHNGTRVFNPGEMSWRTLGADEFVVLRPGGRLVLGRSTFEYQSIQRQ